MLMYMYVYVGKCCVCGNEFLLCVCVSIYCEFHYLYMCVLLCACLLCKMFICMYAHFKMIICMYAHLFWHAYVFMYVCMHICHICMHICIMYVCMCVCVCVCLCVCLYVCRKWKSCGPGCTRCKREKQMLWNSNGC